MTDSLLHELSALEAELHHPGVRSSRARLEQLLHPAFREVGKSGRAYTRETVIAHLLGEHLPTAIEATDYAVSALGDDWALLTYRSSHDHGPGGSRQWALRASLWQRGPEGWRLFFHQGTVAA